jgi:hypothetical protein
MENHALRDRMETTLWKGLAPAVRIEQFVQEFADEMRALPPGITRVIISTEFIYILLRSQLEVQRLHDLLAPHFGSMKMVVYLRRQDAHFTSLYTQLLRSGEVIAPEQLKMRPRPLHELDYAKILDRWVSVFGRESVVPRLFEKPAGGRFDAVQDFLQVCGLSLPGAEEAPKESNQSMNTAGQRLLVDLGRLIQAKEKVKIVAGPLWKSLTDAVTAAAPGAGWRPARAAAQAFYAGFDESNEAVRQAWFPDRPALFDTDFSDYPEQPETPDRDALYEAACATILKVADREQERTVRLAHDAVKQARQAGNPARLRAALQRCMRADPAHVGIRLALAEILLEEGSVQKARGLVAAATSLAPEDARVKKLAGRLGDAPGKKRARAAKG